VDRVHVIGDGASFQLAQPRRLAASSQILHAPSTISTAFLPLSSIVHRLVGVFELADAICSSESVHVTAWLWSAVLIAARLIPRDKASLQTRRLLTVLQSLHSLSVHLGYAVSF
jgi:hypothetical protein